MNLTIGGTQTERQYRYMKNARIARLLLAMAMILAVLPLGAQGEEAPSTRWADAADAIDRYLDAAFEAYLDGDPKAAYDNVSNAYFRVYETTGFERQTMSYISGNRKNAVEMQFSNCKAAVKKDNAEQDTKVSVRSALTKLKGMIREDANKLASQQGGAQKFFHAVSPRLCPGVYEKRACSSKQTRLL